MSSLLPRNSEGCKSQLRGPVCSDETDVPLLAALPPAQPPATQKRALSFWPFSTFSSTLVTLAACFSSESSILIIALCCAVVFSAKSILVTDFFFLVGQYELAFFSASLFSYLLYPALFLEVGHQGASKSTCTAVDCEIVDRHVEMAEAKRNRRRIYPVTVPLIFPAFCTFTREKAFHAPQCIVCLMLH